MNDSSFDLIVISSERNSDSAETVSKLFDTGLQIFHLRKPDAGETELIYFLEALPREFHEKVVLHSHFQLADKFGVKGVHLNEENKKEINEFIGHKIISASFHSLGELRTNTFPYEYIFLSPVFDSISKPGYGSGFDLKQVEKELKKYSAISKAVALGGVTENNLHLVKDAGFSGAAVLGAIWESEDPVNAFLRINAVAQKL